MKSISQIRADNELRDIYPDELVRRALDRARQWIEDAASDEDADLFGHIAQTVLEQLILSPYGLSIGREALIEWVLCGGELEQVKQELNLS